MVQTNKTGFSLSDAPEVPAADLPRYAEIADLIQKDIEDGHLAIGDQLEPEQSLAARFSVSRFTLRAALSLLVERGLVSRRRRHGTVVIASRSREPLVQKLHSMDELLQYDPQTRLRPLLTELFEVDVALSHFLQVPVGDRWARIDTIREQPGRPPICWTSIYVPADYADVGKKIGVDATPTFQLMEQIFGQRACDINAELFAGALVHARAQALGVPAGSPALIIIRRYRDAQGKLFEVSVSEHPAGRFSYAIDLHRETKGRHA